MACNEWQVCNVMGNNRSKNGSIPGGEFLRYKNRTDVVQNYRWSLGLFSFSSADPKGRVPANKKIHERGIVGREEFGRVLWIAMQFRTDGSPLCVQPNMKVQREKWAE